MLESRDRGFDVTVAATLEAGLRVLAAASFDVVLLDLTLPDSQGLDTCRRVVERAPRAPIVVLSGLQDYELAVQAVREGAQDYLPKGQISPDALTRSLAYAIERKHAEEEFRYLAEFVQSIVESTDLGIYALDRDGYIQVWNGAMERQFGVAAEDLVGKTVFEAFPALESEPLGERLRRALADGVASEYLGVRHLTLRKGERLLNTRINPLGAPAGGLGGVVVVTEDVTEFVQAQESLAESERTYRTLYDTTLLLADETASDAVVRLIADQALALLSGDDCIVYLLDRAQGLLTPLYANTRKGAEAVMAYKVKLGTGLTGRVAVSREGGYLNVGAPDGVTVHIPGTDARDDERESVIAVPMLDGDQTLGVITICKDGGVFDDNELAKLTVFTRQAEIAIKRARNVEALRTSEERYRSLVETIHEGFAMVDGDENILFVNQAYCDMFGYTRDELLRMKITDLVPPEEIPKTLETTAVKKAKKVSTKYEVTMRRKDGERRDVIVSSAPLVDENGAYKTTIGVALDITDIKRTEQELKVKTKQLEEAHRRADELLRNLLPNQVIQELAETGAPAPRLVRSATIVFVDFVGFTKISERVNHKALFMKLAAFFHAFDLIVKSYGLEKLKTAGDNYMFAGGLFAARNQVDVCADAALDILKFVATTAWRVRIGIHVGPVIAGLVKGWRMIYDVWGQTVNLAARLEQTAEENRVNCSREVCEQLRERFDFEPRGELEAHNMGVLPMYYLLGRKAGEAEGQPGTTKNGKLYAKRVKSSSSTTAKATPSSNVKAAKTSSCISPRSRAKALKPSPKGKR